jgi:hypothetical protein
MRGREEIFITDGLQSVKEGKDASLDLKHLFASGMLYLRTNAT